VTLENDPEKWVSVLREDHAPKQNLKRDEDQSSSYRALNPGEANLSAATYGKMGRLHSPPFLPSDQSRHYLTAH
jgi:hypothetical protein